MSFAKRITNVRPFGNSASGNIQRAYESDRGRVINSAAIRRLQQKTQVFPLERNAVVRSRLTHSMEVLQVGRFIVQKIAEKFRGARHLDKFNFLSFEREIETLVEMSCLLHDVGNPPFGHFGEYAIGRWFTQFLGQQPLSKAITHPQLTKLAALFEADLSCFEGNAQAIRLIYSLLRFNLTYSQAACVIKYTRPAYLQKPSGNYLQKKPGFYLSEKNFVDNLYDRLAMTPGSRFPLTYIMEAADDISYGIADMEDAVEKGIFTYESLANSLKQQFELVCHKKKLQEIPTFASFNNERSFDELIDECVKKACKEPINQTHEFFIRLRVTFNHILVEYAAEQFIEHQQQVFDGTLNRALLEDGQKYQLILDTFSQLSIKYIFSHKEVETLELQGNRILTALLNEYSPLLMLPAESFSLLQSSAKDFPVEHRLFKRLPQQYVSAYSEALKPKNLQALSQSIDYVSDEAPEQLNILWERYFRCRLLIDFISGMTDQHALDEYHALCVIK